MKRRAGPNPVSRSRKRKPAKKRQSKKPADDGPYNLWNPPPDFQKRLEEHFKDLKIDLSVKIDEEQIKKSLEDLAEQLKPFQPRRLSDAEWCAMMFRPICDHR